VGLSLLIAMCTGIPIGIIITRNKEMARKVIAGPM
jgi:ABC-type proline/glycine betaine transport system permease subunit